MKRVSRVVPTLAAAVSLLAGPAVASAQGTGTPATADSQTTADKQAKGDTASATTGGATTGGAKAAPGASKTAAPAAATATGTAAPPAAPAPEENVLSETPPSGAPAPGTAKTATDTHKGDDTSTFGAELLSLMGVSASWHGYGDVRFRLNPSGDKVGEESVSDFEASANPILTARMGQSFSAETEFELATDTGIAAEYYIVDYTVAQAFTLRAGKFIAPIGRYNEVLHPTFRWDMISKPLMFEEVIPTTWTPVGIQVRGTVTPAVGTALQYAAYVCNGFSGTQDFRKAPAILDAIHDVLQDSNNDKAVGARVGFAFLRGQDVGDTEIGLSGYTGAVDSGGGPAPHPRRPRRAGEAGQGAHPRRGGPELPRPRPELRHPLRARGLPRGRDERGRGGPGGALRLRRHPAHGRGSGDRAAPRRLDQVRALDLLEPAPRGGRAHRRRRGEHHPRPARLHRLLVLARVRLGRAGDPASADCRRRRTAG